jgi:hypothetical protein
MTTAGTVPCYAQAFSPMPGRCFRLISRRAARHLAALLTGTGGMFRRKGGRDAAIR